MHLLGLLSRRQKLPAELLPSHLTQIQPARRRDFRYLFENRDKDGRILPPEAAPATPAAAASAAAPTPAGGGPPRGVAAADGGGSGAEPTASRGEVTSEASHAPPPAAAAAAESGGVNAPSPPAPGGGGGGTAAAPGGGLIRIVVKSGADSLGQGGAPGSSKRSSGDFDSDGRPGPARGSKRPRPDASPISPAEGDHAPVCSNPGPPPLPPLPPTAEPGGGADAPGGVERLVKARRLCLVVDIDNVLVGSARFGQVPPEADHRLQGMLAQQVGDWPAHWARWAGGAGCLPGDSLSHPTQQLVKH